MRGLLRPVLAHFAGSLALMASVVLLGATWWYAEVQRPTSGTVWLPAACAVVFAAGGVVLLRYSRGGVPAGWAVAATLLMAVAAGSAPLGLMFPAAAAVAALVAVALPVSRPSAPR